MVDVGGKPCLERIIGALLRGVTGMVIVTGYMAQVIEAYFGDGNGVTITYKSKVQDGTEVLYISP